MESNFTLTTEMAIAILNGLDAEIVRYKDLAATAEQYAPDTITFWQTRLERSEKARHAVMNTRWAD